MVQKMMTASQITGEKLISRERRIFTPGRRVFECRYTAIKESLYGARNYDTGVTTYFTTVTELKQFLLDS